MDLRSKILQSIDENTRQSISKKTDTKPETVDKIIQIGVPILLGSLGKNAADKKGAIELSDTLDKQHDGSLLDNISTIFSESQDTNNDGLKILGHIFGQKQDAAEVRLAKKTGVDAATIVKVLSFVAPIVLAQIGKKKKAASLDKDGLVDLLKEQKTGSGNPIIDLATKFLDKDSDGQIIDDLFGMFTKGGK